VITRRQGKFSLHHLFIHHHHPQPRTRRRRRRTTNGEAREHGKTDRVGVQGTPAIFFLFFKILLTATQYSRRTRRKCAVREHALVGMFLVFDTFPALPFVSNTTNVPTEARFWCSTHSPPFPSCRTRPPSPFPSWNTRNVPLWSRIWCLAPTRATHSIIP